jgi:hypothetical protein
MPQPFTPTIPSECDSSITKVISLLFGINLRKERSISLILKEVKESVKIVILSFSLSKSRGFSSVPIKKGWLVRVLIVVCVGKMKKVVGFRA